MVTCNIPQSIINVLLMEDPQNLDFLKKVELISLTINYYL